MKKLFYLALLLLLPFEANAAVIYTQPLASGLLQSSWLDPDGSDADQYVWDNFTLSSTQTIRKIKWSGGYDPFKFGYGGPVLDFSIAIYASIPAGGEPDLTIPPLAQYMVGGNAGETPNGSYYDYQFILPAPFTASAGTEYWVQIEAYQHGYPPDWGIAGGSGGDGIYFVRHASPAGDIVYEIASGDAAFTLLNSAINSPPVANAGPDQSFPVGTLITLDGSASSDVDGDPLTYAWAFISRPAGSVAALSDATAVNPTFLVDKVGTYVVQLIVNDGTVNSAPDTVSISTSNSAPVANAGPDQSFPVGTLISLDGSASSDVDGNPLTYFWSFTSMPAGSTAALSSPTAVKPTFLVDKAGTYVAQLIVDDGLVSSAPDTISISTSNSPPVANAGPDQTVPVSTTVTLNGGGSSDVDGNPLTYFWSFASTPASSTAAISNPAVVNPTFVVDLPGTYVAQLIVDDGLVSSAPDTVSISTSNSAPVANAGPDQTVPVGTLVALDGSASSDVDGNPLTYFWSFTSMPAGSTAALSSPTAVKPTFLVDKAGTYVVQLIVDDGLVSSAPDTISISTSNSAPVANAGPDQTVPVGTLVTLDGSASTDVDGNPLAYFWSFTSTPSGSTAALSNPTVVNPTFVVDVAGTYVVQLIVNDGVVDGAPDTVSISTSNSPPVANAGPDQTVFVGDTITLNGSQSSDVDLDPLTYAWSLLSKPAGSTAALSEPAVVNPTIVVDKSGTYVVQLIVNDGKVNSAPDSVTITTQNSAPVANAGPDQTVPAGSLVQLAGSGSDPDGDSLTYAWTWVNKPAGSTATLSNPNVANPTFLADVKGLYELSLTVSDGTATATDNVIITAQNRPPVANAGPDQTVLAGSLVQLAGSGTDADGDTLSYAWTWVSKPAGSTATLSNTNIANPTFVADVKGLYELSLTVSDGTATATDNVIITAQAPPDTTPPVIGAVSNITAEATSPSGAVVTFALPTATDNVDPAPQVSASPPSGSTFPLGTTTVTVTATDAAGNTSTKTFTVTVRDTTPPVIGAVSNVMATATSPAGAVVTFALPTAKDTVDPSPVVTSSPASGSTFPIGTTSVTVTAKDAANNTSTKTFTVTVNGTSPTPGMMHGEGWLDQRGNRNLYEFEVREKATGADRGHLLFSVRAFRPGRDDGDRDDMTGRADRFVSTRLTDVVFHDLPGVTPGGRATMDTVVVKGIGRWNGVHGYAFTATATDAGEPGAGRDLFAITITAPNGTPVVSVSGTITRGNNQSNRVKR